MKVLEVKNLKKNYFAQKILQNISFELEKGEIISILGPSGSGKTTLLRILSMLETIDSGEIVFNEKNKFTSNSEENNKKKILQEIGVVSQEINLWEHKNVIENVSEPLRVVKKYSKEDSKKLAIKALKKVKLDKLLKSNISQLSGGQKQRVAIARCIASSPKILLFDEITSALDPELVREVLNIIKNLAKEHHSMIIVTHHINFALEISDKILFLENGKIIEENTPKKLIKSKNKKIQSFLKSFKYL